MDLDTQELDTRNADATAPKLIIPQLGQLYRLFDPVSYAVLRLGFGIVLLTHGLPKVLGHSHGSMDNPLASSMRLIDSRLHLPAAEMLAYFVTFLESGGALGIALGFMTRIFAAMITFEMIGICFVLAPAWVWLDKGMEYPVLMGLLALHIAFKGAGRYSIDKAIGREI